MMLYITIIIIINLVSPLFNSNPTVVPYSTSNTVSVILRIDIFEAQTLLSSNSGMVVAMPNFGMIPVAGTELSKYCLVEESTKCRNRNSAHSHFNHHGARLSYVDERKLLVVR
jgi:hypothetical protein